MSICEFCGKEAVTASSSFNGGYCEECYDLVIAESKAAINEIRLYQGKPPRYKKPSVGLVKKTHNKTIEELREEAERSLAELLNPTWCRKGE